MAIYSIKRLLMLIPTLLLVSFFVFLLIHLIPGDPAMNILGMEASREDYIALREELGLNRPLLTQYVFWLGRVVTGDLGKSLISSLYIRDMILQRFGPTFSIALFAFLISILLAIPAGVISASRQNTKIDYLVMFLSMVGLSIPGFWAGLLLIMLFSLTLGWFPATGYVPLTENLVQGIRYLVLPSISLGLVQAAVVARMTRSSMLEVLRQDYVLTARAKGLAEKVVIYRHAFKNALISVITILGMNFGTLLGGTVIIETIFSIPGLGRLVVFSIYNRDYPVIQAVILYLAVLYILINLLVDMAYSYINPRIRYA